MAAKALASDAADETAVMASTLPAASIPQINLDDPEAPLS